MKKNRRLNAKLKVRELNSIFFNWKRAKKKDSSAMLSLFKPLSDIRWAGGAVGQIDVSSLVDLGPFSERKTDLLQREIVSTRTVKNEKIEVKAYDVALVLIEKENQIRCDLNKMIAYKIFGRHACFYCFEETKIGFVFRGNHEMDSTLENEVRKVFPQIPVYSQVFYEYGIKKLNAERKNTDDEKQPAIAA